MVKPLAGRMIGRAMPLNRRSTLTRLSQWAALLAARRTWAAPDPNLPVVTRPRLDSDPFQLGVASGQPRAHSVVLWTRLTAHPGEPGGGLPPALIPVQWQVADDATFSRMVRTGVAMADPAQAHSLRVVVKNLTPGRVFFYRFIVAGQASPVGRTRTAPAHDAATDRLRLALASCQHYEQGWFIAQREIATQDIDFVLFVGDYIYDNSNSRHRIRLHEADSPVTLDQFRARYAHYKKDPDLRAAHAAHPWIVTWDDHEVRNDYAGAVGDDDMSPQAFIALRAAAYQAYFEHLPLAPDQQSQGGRVRLADHFRWGRLADLWTLDCRQFRSVQACNGPWSGGHLRWACREIQDERRSMLGPEQEQWLDQGLRSATGRWKLIGQSSQISAWGVRGPARRTLVYSDGWDGYPRARERMLARIGQQRIDNVVFLGGDVHRHVAASLRVRPNDPASPVVASEFVTTSLTTVGMPAPAMSLIRRSNPDILHARSDERGYMLLDVKPQSLHCVARGTGFPVLAEARLATQASFRVESGRAGPQRE